MTPIEVNGLASATCSWLAYRHAVGLESTLYERILLVPIAEYLARTSWVAENERSYRKLFDDQELMDHYCDIVATKKYGQSQFALETKLLKGAAKNRVAEIEKDIVRLGAPVGGIKRYFLLAGLDKYFPPIQKGRAPKAARIFDKLLSYSYDEGFGASLSSPSDEFSRPPQYIRRCADVQAPVGRDGSFRVSIWSVSPPSLSTA